MPKASSRVLGTDRELRAAAVIGDSIDRTEYRIKGAPGLQLRVSRSGTKGWAYAYKSPATGRWAKVALGTYPAIGLAEAKSSLPTGRATFDKAKTDP